jgi:hypothetical protein
VLFASSPVVTSSHISDEGSENETASAACETGCYSDELERRKSSLVENSRGLRLTFTGHEGSEGSDTGSEEDDQSYIASQFASAKRSPTGAMLLGGSINIIAFFFQMAGRVMPATGMPAKLGLSFESFFGLRVAELVNGCIWAGMGSLDKVKLMYAAPCVMGLVLGLISFTTQALAWFTNAKVCVRAKCCGTSDTVPCEQQPRPQQRTALFTRVPGALAKLLLFAYSTLTDTTLELLNCVPLPGHDEHVVFRAGGEKCGGWQAPLYALLVLLVLLPIVPLLVFAGRRLPPLSRLGTVAHAILVPAHPAAQALHSSLTNEFFVDQWHWPALLALQRLAMVATPIFVKDSIKSSLVLTSIALVAAFLQFRAVPYINADVDAHAKLSACCLLALAMLNAPQRALSQASVDLAASSTIKQVCDNIESAMLPFLLAPVVAPVLVPLLKVVNGRVQSSFFGSRSAMSMYTMHAESGELSAPLVPERARGVV